jgi:hypothetical protein
MSYRFVNFLSFLDLIKLNQNISTKFLTDVLRSHYNYYLTQEASLSAVPDTDFPMPTVRTGI